MNYQKTLRELGISYLGKVAQSAKMRLSYEHGTMTYCLYLAPWNMVGGGHNVCGYGKECAPFCLQNSGRNIGDTIAHGYEGSAINRSRIRKTRLFYENRELFMDLLIHEIRKYKAKAERMGYGFSIRLNGTSDLSPILFKKNGKNILEIFNDVQFYDYTKNPNRYNIAKRYSNYDLTFSYNGYNDAECREVLKNGGRVAVVFYGDMPKTFGGYTVESGNEFDMRYLNSPQSVIGLHYHKTANDYKVINGKRTFVAPNTPFVIMPNDKRCELGF